MFSRHRSLAALALASALAAAPAAAQDRDYRIDTTLAVGRDAVVDLGLTTGSINVTASNRAEVRIDAYSERLPLRFEHVGNTVRVRIDSRYDRRYNSQRTGTQRMEIVVPVGTRVTAATVSGNVTVRGVRGEVEASAVSGSVTVDDAVRRATLTTVSGRVRGTAIDGDVRATIVSGSLDLTDVAGQITAESVSGNVTMRGARSDRVRAQSVSGNITYDGTVSRTGRYELRTHSGNLRLVLPDDAGASLHAQTFSGRVQSTLEVVLGPTSRTPGRRNDLELTIGGGGGRIEAQTFSGNIDVGRAERRSDRN